MDLKIGKQAPDFELPDQEGKSHKLSDYHGKWVLLYFYPKDDTAGCTAEACGIRDRFSDFGKHNAVVLGVSKDSVKSHGKFATKYTLPFTILADEELSVIKQYRVWGKKSMYGREYDGVLRTSFLIDPTGKIAKIYEKVKASGHAAEVLRDLTELAS